MPVRGQADEIDVLRAAAELSPQGQAITGPDGTFQSVNQRFAALLNRDDPADLAGHDWRAVFDEHSVERLEAEGLPGTGSTTVGVDAGAGSAAVECWTRSLGQDRRAWYVRRSDPDRDDGTLERYETILKNLHDGVYTLDASGRITWVNEVAVDDHDIGYSRDELIGAPVSKVLSDEDIEKCLDIIQDLLDDETRDSGRCRISIQTANDETIPCELHLGLLPAEDAEFPGTVGVLRDITDRRRREQRLTVMNRVLRHNLRNSLNVIMGHAEMLDRHADPEVGAAAERIRSTASELADLSEKARAIETSLDHHEPVARPVDLAGIVEGQVEAYRTRYPHAEFDLEVPESAVVQADPMLDSVVDNLVENAVVHHDGPAPMVHLTVSEPADPDDRIVLTVADDGPGIDAAERESVESGTETVLEHGSGLGLWLCKWLVENNGGDIEITERSPRGTRVRVWFPQATSSDGTDPLELEGVAGD